MSTIGNIKFKNSFTNTSDSDGYHIKASDGSKLLSFDSSAALLNCTVKQYIDLVTARVAILESTVISLENRIATLEGGV